MISTADKLNLISLNLADDMRCIDSNLLSLMGNLHEYRTRTKDSREKAITDIALETLANQVVPLLDELLMDLTDYRETQ